MNLVWEFIANTFCFALIGALGAGMYLFAQILFAIVSLPAIFGLLLLARFIMGRVL